MRQRCHEEFVGYRIYETHRALSRLLEKTLEPFGLTPSEWNALNQLARLGALSQKDLAHALDKEQATVTRSIDRMVRKGFVTREPDPHDRRANVISLTPAADELLIQVEPFAVGAADDAEKDISSEELDMFLDVLKRIKDNANQGK